MSKKIKPLLCKMQAQAKAREEKAVKVEPPLKKKSTKSSKKSN